MEERKNISLTPLIAQALQKQWQMLIQRLPKRLQEQMTEPQFKLTPDLSEWGMWHGGASHCIELNMKLFTRHPWYAVTDVLAHETAHQLSELLRRMRNLPLNDQPPHGERFRECCRMLNARPDASGNFPTLDELIYRDDEDTAEAEGATSEQARLVIKVRKLLALSGSSNQSEAESALLKAREIMAKYDLDEALGSNLSQDEHAMYTIHLGPPMKRVAICDSQLAGILNEFFNVACVWDYTPDPAMNGNFLRILSISGERKHIRVAAYTYDCIQNYMGNAEKNLPSKLFARILTSATARRDFRSGILTGIANALREQHQSPQMRALVVAQRARLDNYLSYVFPHIRIQNHRSRLCDTELRGAGEMAGRKMHLKPGIEEASTRTGGTKPKLLT